MNNYVKQYVHYYNPLHVSSNSVLIIRRLNCINTAFSVSDRPVCTCTSDVHLQRTLYQTVAYPGILVGGGGEVQQIQLRTEDTEKGDLGAVVP